MAKDKVVLVTYGGKKKPIAIPAETRVAEEIGWLKTRFIAKFEEQCNPVSS